MRLFSFLRSPQPVPMALVQQQPEPVITSTTSPEVSAAIQKGWRRGKELGLLSDVQALLVKWDDAGLEKASIGRILTGAGKVLEKVGRP